MTVPQIAQFALDTMPLLTEAERPLLARSTIGTIIKITANGANCSVRRACRMWVERTIAKGDIQAAELAPVRALFDAAGYPGARINTVAVNTLRDWVAMPFPVKFSAPI